MENNTIYFYDLPSDTVLKEHIFLNNFELSEFKGEDGFIYPTVEHYYQCHKFGVSEPAFEEIR
jgi:predicted NAD-dependent protein-ADP-ribosyltransferase YbiA (DUF1768 family)